MGLESLISGGLQTVTGLIQSIGAGKRRRKAEGELESTVNSFQPNQSILDYYDKAFKKYNPNAYQTNQYKQQNKEIQRNVATGLNFAQGRRGALGSVGLITQRANDASARAVGQAEQAQNQDFAQLGQAAGMKTNEEQKKFDMIYNLKAMKAGAASDRQNAGIKNLFGGLSTVAYGGLDGLGGIGGNKNRRQSTSSLGQPASPRNPNFY